MAFSGPGPGRPKGSQNKTTTTVKAALQSVYDALQAKSGRPHGHLEAWANDQPTEFYKLYAKLLPQEVAFDPDAPLVNRIEIKIVDA